MISGKIWMLGLRLMVVTIIWGLNCLIRMSMLLSLSSSLHPSFAFELSIPHKVVMIFQLEHFVTIRLVGCCFSISKMLSLMSGHS
jgi:hypothetical protein